MAKRETMGAAVQAAVIINQNQLTKLLSARRSTSKQVDELNGSYRSKLATAVEKNNLHKKAYATLVTLDKMEPEQALEYWTHLIAYMDLAGITEKIDSVAKLPLQEKPEGGEGDVGGEPPTSLAERRKQRQQQEEEQREAVAAE